MYPKTEQIFLQNMQYLLRRGTCFCKKYSECLRTHGPQTNRVPSSCNPGGCDPGGCNPSGCDPAGCDPGGCDPSSFNVPGYSCPFQII